jgi:hypothetical protein
MSGVVIYERAMHRFLTKRTGPVAKIIDEKAERIRSAAETNLMTKTEARTGDLEGSLRKIPRDGPGGYHVVVGSDAKHRGFPYAKALETGINPLTGVEMNFKAGKLSFAFMVPAVRTAGFRLRRA